MRVVYFMKDGSTKEFNWDIKYKEIAQNFAIDKDCNISCSKCPLSGISENGFYNCLNFNMQEIDYLLDIEDFPKNVTLTLDTSEFDKINELQKRLCLGSGKDCQSCPDICLGRDVAPNTLVVTERDFQKVTDELTPKTSLLKEHSFLQMPIFEDKHIICDALSTTTAPKPNEKLKATFEASINADGTIASKSDNRPLTVSKVATGVYAIDCAPKSVYLALDNETGGLAGTSLLTSYLAVLDKDLNVLDDLYLYMKPDDGIYRVEAQGMGVNKINLLEHDKVAIPYKKAGTILYEFLKKHSDNGATKLIPVGHNVTFDILGITDNLLSPKTWNNCVSYRKLDTGGIAQYLKACGKLPDDNKGSLEHLASFFNLVPVGVLHDACTDTLLTVEVLKSMIKLIKGDL